MLIPAILVFALSLSLTLAAQTVSGDVQGRVADKEGKPLAGVKVTLSKGQDADRRTTTDPAGRFRFPAVYPGPDYAVKAERPDHKTAVRSGVVVLVGGHVTVDLVLEPGKPEEQAAASGTLPAIDRKATTRGPQFGRTELQTLPTVRDPWAIAALAPGVLIDRENVGGNESGRQAALVAKGDSTNGADNVWFVDGIDVTDPLEVGTSSIRFDFDAIETVAVTTGGAADVTRQTGGIALTLVGRRGGNRLGATARLYLSDEAFQSSNMTSTPQLGRRHRHQPDRAPPGLRVQRRRARRQEPDLAVGRLRQPGPLQQHHLQRARPNALQQPQLQAQRSAVRREPVRSPDHGQRQGALRGQRGSRQARGRPRLRLQEARRPGPQGPGPADLREQRLSLPEVRPAATRGRARCPWSTSP
ncbi:MAG: carboxypeptidase-like regulatory domain-containing protein [Sphingobacterium sp.]|nr:carboxypeptidase-like regulatory domain-containing protein [Sphingobacterium sp.]